MREPELMEECVYFTNRSDGKGYVKAWVLRDRCPSCKEGLMSKPKNPKTGRYKTRANKYVCDKCDFTIDKEDYESTLTISIKYKCSYCSYEGELQLPFKRIKIRVMDEETGKKKSVDAIRFQCEKCKEDIDIIKKMKG